MAKQIRTVLFIVAVFSLFAAPLFASLGPCLCHPENVLSHSSKKAEPPCHSHKSRAAKGVVSSSHANCQCHLDAPDTGFETEIGNIEISVQSKNLVPVSGEIILPREVAQSSLIFGPPKPYFAASPIYLSTLRLRL